MASRNIASAAQGYREYYEKFKTTSLWKLLSGPLFTFGQSRNVNPSIPPSNSRCCFKELPPEIRLMIYGSLFEFLPTDLEDAEKKNLNALLFANKSIFLEAVPTFRRCIQRHDDQNDEVHEREPEKECLAVGLPPQSLAEAMERLLEKALDRLIVKIDSVMSTLACCVRARALLQRVNRWERKIRMQRGVCFCGQCP